MTEAEIGREIGLRLQRAMQEADMDRGELARRGPGLGEHNDTVLRELGFDAKDIDGLRASGAVPKAKERAA